MTEERAQAETRPRWLGFIQRPWYTVLHSLVSMEWCGSEDVPLRDKTLLKWELHDDKSNWDGQGYRYAGFIDGYQIGIGWHNKWDCLIRREHFHQIVLNYLKVWVFLDWFGLRTKIYYLTLHKIVEGHKNARKQ